MPADGYRHIEDALTDGWYSTLTSGVGGVAQLGERLLCKQEVIGSIPFTSTNLAGVRQEGRGRFSESDREKQGLRVASRAWFFDK
jgi:hypothetical protein